MKYLHQLTALLLCALVASCHPQPQQDLSARGDILAFGSCVRQWQKQPVWQAINALEPEAFIFLGDNVYADVGELAKKPEPERIGDAYRQQAQNPDFKAFLDTASLHGTQLLATWDDHDYGVNDGGAEYQHKLASKRYFLDFFNLEATASGDARQPGIYQSVRTTLGKLDVQVLLLDTRSFRSPLNKAASKAACPPTGIVANENENATVLGEAQWAWLADELLKPADLRIIASSIQVIPEQHCFEKWANFPRERMRLFELIRSTGAEGVVLLSGDRHLAEISVLPEDVIGYPLYEVTASGLNSAIGSLIPNLKEDNRYRTSPNNVTEDNFGTLELRDSDQDTLVLQVRSTRGNVRLEEKITLDRLSPKRSN